MKTYGYDYVFALDGAAVNAVLARNLQGVDQTVSYSALDPESGSTITLNATLGAWQLVGGSNTLINLDIPIVSGKLSLTGGAITGSADLAGVVPEIQVSLGWVGVGDQQAATGSGDLTQLTWDPQQGADPNNPGYVATLTVHDPENKLNQVESGILADVMAKALVENHDKVAYVFANVNPAPAQLAPWLAAAEWQYFFDAAAGPHGTLCFLCMLAAGAQLPSQPSFDPSALQPGANAVLLISQPVFFSNVVLPSVKSTFAGGAFQLATNAEELSTVTSTGSFNVGTVTANSYSLQANPAGNGLAASSSGGGPLKFLFGLANLPNASYSWSISTNNPLTFDGTNVTFSSDPSPTINHDETIPWYDWILLVVLGITNAVGLASMIYDLVKNFNDQAQNVGMSGVNTTLQSATGGAVVNAGQLVAWTKGAQSLTPTGAGMSESLYVAGNIAVQQQDAQDETVVVPTLSRR